MDTIQLLHDRLRFVGLPAERLGQVSEAVRSGASWRAACRPHARLARTAALAARAAGRRTRATALWIQTAAWRHASAFDLHDTTTSGWRPETARRLRATAVAAFSRAVDLGGSAPRHVRIGHGQSAMDGYLLTPAGPSLGAVVLLNGLDSMCECELYRLARRLTRFRLHALLLDVPAGYRSGTPCLALEGRASAIADWLEQQTCSRLVVAMGVSFGGHFAARLASGDGRFVRTVMVSPGAWIDPVSRLDARLRRMAEVTLTIAGTSPLSDALPRCDIRDVPPPQGQLLLYAMSRDALFGVEHEHAYIAWARSRIEVRRVDAEHAGTSRMAHWLPAAARWLSTGVTP